MTAKFKIALTYNETNRFLLFSGSISENQRVFDQKLSKPIAYIEALKMLGTKS